jgi:hypothetical protein
MELTALVFFTCLLNCNNYKVDVWHFLHLISNVSVDDWKQRAWWRIRWSDIFSACMWMLLNFLSITSTTSSIPMHKLIFRLFFLLEFDWSRWIWKLKNRNNWIKKKRRIIYKQKSSDTWNCRRLTFPIFFLPWRDFVLTICLDLRSPFAQYAIYIFVKRSENLHLQSWFCGFHLKVIGKLSEGKSSHVPYRDSKLTRLLQSSLSGHGHVSVSLYYTFNVIIIIRLYLTSLLFCTYLVITCFNEAMAFSLSFPSLFLFFILWIYWNKAC